MRRRQLIGGATVSLLGWPLVARAQQTTRPRRIAMVMGVRDDDVSRQRIKSFVDGLRQLGWEEGRNVGIDIHWADGDPQRIKALAQEVVEHSPDIVLANGVAAVARLKAATQRIPVVFASAADPVEAGLAESMARPGGNITGFTNFEHAISAKWLELMKEVAPRVVRVVLLYNPEHFAWRRAVPLMRSVAPRLGVELAEAPIANAHDIRQTIAAQAGRTDTGVLAFPEATTNSHRDLIVAEANANALPSIYAYREFCRAGGLVSYGVDVLDLFRRAAGYVDRILRGESPAELPIQAPTRFELVLNLKTAKALGLEVPMTLLVRADEVIE